jgi:glycerophosphoryl diester phosphodiesterase
MIRRTITTFIVITMAAGIVGYTPAALAAACVTPGVVAHRGGSERFAENTRNAFRDASNIGVGFWETDVRFLADDTPVVMHDATVDRTTDGTGDVADLTLAQWQALRTADDQPPPTLAEVMNDQSVDRAYAFVELKVTPTAAQWSSFTAAITSRAGAGTPKPVISSFDPDVLDEVAARLPGYGRALIQSVGDADPADVTPHASILLKHHDAITAARLTKWTNAGIKVWAWADAGNDPPSEWERMAGYSSDAAAGSVSGYITSSPRGYNAWRNARTC